MSFNLVHPNTNKNEQYALIGIKNICLKNWQGKNYLDIIIIKQHDYFSGTILLNDTWMKSYKAMNHPYQYNWFDNMQMES